MPAGVSWPTYLKFALASGLSMIAGAQTVHQLYRPLEDLEEWVKNFEEQQKIIEEVRNSEAKTAAESPLTNLRSESGDSVVKSASEVESQG
jgi:3-methyladenine DNA glycosylase Tag